MKRHDSMRNLATWVSVFLLAGCVAKPQPPVVSESPCAYPSGDVTLRGMLYRPAGEGPFPAMVVVHDDFGLTDWYKERAWRLAERGYLTLAVDLYRGEVVSNILDAHIMERGLPEDRVQDDLRAAAAFLTARSDVRADAMGIIGWDIGGGHALDAALRDRRWRAVATCYGRLTTDPALLASLNGSVLGIFGEQDEGITPQTIAQFRAAMNQAGKRIAGLHVYPGCGHGFMNPTGSKPTDLATKAAVDAWSKIENFLAAELQR